MRPFLPGQISSFDTHIILKYLVEILKLILKFEWVNEPSYN